MANLITISNSNKPSSKTQARLAASLVLLLQVLSLSAVSAQWQAPLSQREINTLREHTEQHWNQQLQARITQSPPATKHELGLEIVLIELKEQKSNDPANRTAQVYLFDYNTGISSLEERKVATGELLNTYIIDRPFLPLTQREIDYTKQLLGSNEALLHRLQYEHQRQFQSALSHLNQLEMKIAIWQPMVQHSPFSSTCAKQRCAMVSIFTQNHFSFSVEPVVNLMNASVSLNEFSNQ